MGRLVTLTQKQLQELLHKTAREGAEAQRRQDQETLDDALKEQERIDAGKNFTYFWTAALWILHKDFGFGAACLERFRAALDGMLEDPPSFTEISGKLKEYGFEITVDMVEGTK